MNIDPAPADAFLEDAAHSPGGHARGVMFPRTADDIADILARETSVLPVGVQSSLTGGATPMGELILSTSKLTRIIDASTAGSNPVLFALNNLASALNSVF